MSDDLYDVRNQLQLGLYVQAISDGTNLKPMPYKKREDNDALLLERDVLVARAQIELGHWQSVIDDHSSATTPPLQVVVCLARYTKAESQGNDTLKEQVVEEVKELWRSCEGKEVLNAQTAVVAATLLIRAQELEAALKCIRMSQGASVPAPTGLELSSLAVNIMLRINRPQEAERELKAMIAVDDDATLTQLCTAWVGLAQGGEKLKEAMQAYEDVREKCGGEAGVLILNGMALCHMAECEWEKAEKMLQDALGKRASDAETLINLCICGLHLKKNVDRNVKQLKESHPHHPWVRNLVLLEGKFDTFAQQHSRGGG